MAKQKPKHYLSNKDLLAELKLCYENDSVSNRLLKMFERLILGISKKPNFCRYSPMEEIKQEALIICWKAAKAKKFNVEKSNPFAYFSTCVHFSFLKSIKDISRINSLHEKVINISEDQIHNLNLELLEINNY